MLLVVAALPVELRALGRAPRRGVVEEREGFLLLCTGPGAKAAEASGPAIERARPDRVLHVGLAGGLRSGLGMGDLVVVTATSMGVLDVGAGGALPDPRPCGGVIELRTALARLPDRMAQGAILSVDRFVPDAATKEALGRAGPYLACEMEASLLAAAAQAVGAEYLGLRAISDPCDTDVLPPLRSRGGLRAAADRSNLALAGWRTVKGYRRAAGALDRALPVALRTAQAMSSMSAPASSTNSSGT